MNNDPKVPKDFIQTELQSKVGAPNGHTASPKTVLSRTAMAGVLMVAAIAALAITTLARSDQPAAANSAVATAPVPSMASVPLSVPHDNGEVQTFSFGFLEFEDTMWQAAAPVWSPGRPVSGSRGR